MVREMTDGAWKDVAAEPEGENEDQTEETKGVVDPGVPRTTVEPEPVIAGEAKPIAVAETVVPKNETKVTPLDPKWANKKW